MKLSKYLVANVEGRQEAWITPAEEKHGEAYSWRDAKKALRAYYINKARELRSITEKEYFNNGN